MSDQHYLVQLVAGLESEGLEQVLGRHHFHLAEVAIPEVVLLAVDQ